MKKKLMALALSLSMLTTALPGFTTAKAANPIVAFPGAEGAGRYATGGRGGTVVHVTNLNDSGPGSFRDAVSHSGRIIVFDVGGTINLRSDVIVKGNNTIAGQTAPGGGGITLKGGKIGMGGDNIIIRFVSSRPGENGSSECDAWGGNRGSNSMIDHCSIGWANDEQFGLYSSMQQTVQYSIIGPSNCISYHSKGAHGFGIMMGAGHNTWHHNMIAHNISRNFRGKIGGKNTLDYVNNVIYDWGYQTAYGTFGQVNYVGNYFKRGLSTKGGNRYISMSSGTAPENYRFYLTGNKMVNPNGTDYNSAMNSNNWLGVDYGSYGLTQSNYQVNSPLRVNDVYGNNASVVGKAQSADAAFQTVLSYAGAGISANQRPRIDQQVMQEARTGTGYLTGGRDFSTIGSGDTALRDAISKYNIKQVNYDSYYPAAITRKTIVDTDNDGMPDSWETERGLNPRVNDAMGDYLGQGYNNIEYYINDLTVNAFPAGVVKVSPKGAEIGADFVNAQADANSLSIAPTTIAKVGDLVLPTRGAKGSSITWSSSSSAIVIKNNAISAVNRPASSNTKVNLTATVKNGRYSHTRTFTVTVLAIPYNFDFGNGAVQNGYTAVTSSTAYSSGLGYGFVGSQGAMTRAPGNVPAGYTDLHADQIEGTTTFKANVPNGSYYVRIYYGSWNAGFGTRFNIEGADSGPLASTSASEYVTKVTVKDGVLDVGISLGDNKYGGYINGLDIIPSSAPKYKFDFGDGAVQNGFTGVTAATTYNYSRGYGFEGTSQTAMTRAPGNIPAGYDNLHADQLTGTMKFKADVPNGKYNVAIHYGSWNSSFGTSYVVEGVESGPLSSTGANTYVAQVEVKDGVLDVEIGKGAEAFGGYINGLEILKPPATAYKFDFGDGAAQNGYAPVTASTNYSLLTGYGFVGAQSAMTRAPGNVPAGYDNLHADQIQGTTTFKANIPNGRYNVVIHYGSWTDGFGTSYTVEGVSSGNLYSTSAAKYITDVDITDGVLNVAINKGSQQYGGYINGLEILPPPEPQYHFDFGDGAVQSGYAGVTASTLYSSATGYGFVSASQSAMTRAPGNIPAGYDNLHADQIDGVTEFKADVPNGKYIVTIHYGSWNDGFGTKYTVEGVSSDNLASTDAAQYTVKVEITDGVLDVAINKGSQKYGGYINGMDITPLSRLPYHFDFGDGAVQSGYVAVTSSTVYSEDTEYGFEGAAPGGMTRAPGGIEAGLENLYSDQLNGDGKFKANIPNGTYDVIIHYGSWNDAFGTSYTVEDVSSGNLAATDAAQYRTTVTVTDGMLDVAINKGSQKYGGYISGMDVMQSSATPTPTPTPEDDYKIDISCEPSSDGFTVTGTYSYPKTAEGKIMAILAVYDETSALTGIRVEYTDIQTDAPTPVKISGLTASDRYTVKGMLWQSGTMLPLTKAVSVTAGEDAALNN